MKGDLFDDIILKFLRGDATPHEKSMLRAWLKENQVNEETFYNHLSKQESANPQYFPDVPARLRAYEEFLNGTGTPIKASLPTSPPVLPRRSSSATFWRLAGSLIIFLSASFYFFGDVFVYQTISARDGRVRFVTLPDGSRITLNANSSIKVFRDFMAHDSREVWIRGEGFFEVTKKPNAMKFIVHTDNFDVEVLGTRFNVNNRPGKTEVMLAEGKVKLVAKDKQPLIMKPGEQVTLSDADGHYSRRLVNAEAIQAWRNNKLTFDETPLSEVAGIIEDYYRVSVVIADSALAARQFTGTLPNNDLDVILMALKTAYPIEIQKNNDRIIIKKMSN